MTFGEMVGAISNWSREANEPAIAGDALNDALERLADSVLMVRLSDMLGGPVTLSLAQGAERFTIVTLLDPPLPPTSTAVADPNGLPIRAVNVCYTWVTATGAETLPSPPNALTTSAGTLVQVAYPGTVAGQQPYGWNVYLQQALPDMGQQWQRINNLPVPLGQAALEIPPNLNPSDYQQHNVALPTVNATADSIYYIKRIEMQTPSGTYKRWTQGDFDGGLMSTASNIIASTSPYQNYAFDVTNNATVEIRPALGAALSPRYFYVKRPGRIAFPNVDLPFQDISSAIPFLRYESLGLYFMSVNEPDQAAMWSDKAASTLTSLVLAQTRMRARKDLTVQPFRGMF